MNKEIAALQKLLDVLNDSSILYRRLAPKTTSSHLKLLLERAVRIHQWIADELAQRMTTAGGTPKFGGSLLGPMQALRANWLSRISPDIKLAYATQTLRREDGVQRCFDEAVAGVTDGDLRNHLQMQRREIERACVQIECLVSPMGARVPKEPARQPIRANRTSTRAAGPQRRHVVTSQRNGARRRAASMGRRTFTRIKE